MGRVLLFAFGYALALGGCAKEARNLGPSVTQTAPTGPDDPRIADYLGNAWQVSQGGRYFGWYGCSGCHDASAPDLRRAHLPAAMGFDAIFRAITRHKGHSYGERVPVEQVWQLSAYVADLPAHTPDKRRRQLTDTPGEPIGTTWSGPLR